MGIHTGLGSFWARMVGCANLCGAPPLQRWDMDALYSPEGGTGDTPPDAYAQQHAQENHHLTGSSLGT